MSASELKSPVEKTRGWVVDKGMVYYASIWESVTKAPTLKPSERGGVDPFPVTRAARPLTEAVQILLLVNHQACDNPPDVTRALELLPPA